MVTKLDVLENILNYKFDLSSTQAFKKWQTGITQVDQVSIDNSGDFVRGIITLPTSISKGMGYKEITHDIVIECNSEAVLDEAIEELEAYSFDAKNGYDPITLTDYQYTDIKTKSTTYADVTTCFNINLTSGSISIRLNWGATGGSSPSNKIALISIPVVGSLTKLKLNGIIYNLYGITDRVNKVSVFYSDYSTKAELEAHSDEITAIINYINGTPTLYDFDGTINTNVQEAFDELDEDIVIENTDDKDYALIIFYDNSETTQSSNNIIYSTEIEYYDEDTTNALLYLSKTPYYLEIIEKDRSQASENSYQAQLQLKARYER